MALVRPQYTRRYSEACQTTQGQVMACRAQCAGVGAGKAAQRHQSRHKAQVGGCFADPHKLIDLLQLGVVVARIAVAGRHDLAAVGKAYYHSGPDRLRSRWLWIRLSILPSTRSHRSPAFRFRSASAWIIE